MPSSSHQLDSDKRSIGLVHQKTLSPSNTKERPRSAVKSASVDTSDNQEIFYHQRQQKKQKHQLNVQHQHQLHNLYYQQQHHNSRSKELKSNTIWYNQDDTARSSSVDVHSMTKFEQPNETIIPVTTTTTSNQTPTKRLNRIIYEIGSILSFVGLGKDYRNQQQQQSQQQQQPVINTIDNSIQSSNSNLNIHQSTNSVTITNSKNQLQPQSAIMNSSTRRSQFKKQTPSTIISYSDSVNYDTISNYSTNSSINKSNLLTVSSIDRKSVV